LRDQYDVVIVGGGPSGATAATLLAREHRSVVLVDKARFPRDKPCAGAISGRSARVIASVYGAGLLARLARASSAGCRMFHKQAFVAEASGSERLFFVDRKEMDAALVNAARESGCELLEGDAAVCVDPLQSAVTLASGAELRGSIIIGADGVRSVVRKLYWDRGASGKKGMGFGLVAEAPLDQLADDSFRDACARFPHIFFGILPWGYGWIFPQGDTVSVGIGGLLGEGVEFRKTFQSFVGGHFRPGTWESLNVRGHQFPFGRFERTPGRGNVLLVGDAARLVEPVTGEGIAFALESGQLAALAAERCLSRQSPAEAGHIYNALVQRQLLPHLRQARIGSWMLFSKLCFPIAMHSLKHRPKLVHYYFELVSGKITYTDYVRRMIREFLSRRGSRSG
jgi:menaquinone-9 beta-reductase